VPQVNQVPPEHQVDQDLLERLVTLLDQLDSPDPADRTVHQVSLDPKDLQETMANLDWMDLKVNQVNLVRTADLEKREPALARISPIMDPKDHPEPLADLDMMDAQVGFFK